jgi:DNA gyrase subunit A
MDVINESNLNLLVVSENGYGKVTKVSNFPSHKRGGVGIKAAVVSAKTGPIIDVQTILDDTKEVLIISEDGQTIRVDLKDIPVLGRTTQGVRIMRMGNTDKVASIGLITDKETDEEEEAAK